MSFNFRFLILMLFFSNYSYAQSNSKLDSLKNLLEETDDELKQIEILTKIVVKYWRIDMTGAIPYAKQRIEVAKSIRHDSLTAESIRKLGTIYANLGKPDTAMFYFDTSLPIFQKIGDKKGEGMVYMKYLYVHAFLLDNYDLALKYGHKAMDLYEEIESEMGIMNATVRFADIFFAQKQYDIAIEYANKGLSEANRLKNKSYEKHCLNILSECYNEKKEFQKALSFINSKIEMDSTQNDITSLTIGYLIKADCLLGLGDYPYALKEIEKAMSKAKQSNLSSYFSHINQSHGDILFAQKKYDAAILKYKEAEKSFVADEREVGLASVYFGLSKSYAATDNYKKAYENHIQFKSLSDSSFNEEKTRIINELDTKYETEKKEQEIALLTTKEKAQATQLNYSLGLGGLLLLLLGLLFNRFRENKKNNQLLEEKNGKIELLLKEIHHRVKNNLQTISSLLFLQSAHIKDAEVKEAVAEGQHRVESMALIHQKLYQRDNLAGIEMKDYLTNLGNSLIDTFVNDPDRISLRVDMDEHELDVDTAVPLGLIANELITNSIKYAFPDERKGEIQLKVSNNSDGKLELYVADNGVGNANTKTGTAFGSQLINLLTKQLNGSLEQGTEDGFWTRVIL